MTRFLSGKIHFTLLWREISFSLICSRNTIYSKDRSEETFKNSWVSYYIIYRLLVKTLCTRSLNRTYSPFKLASLSPILFISLLFIYFSESLLQLKQAKLLWCITLLRTIANGHITCLLIELYIWFIISQLHRLRFAKCEVLHTLCILGEVGIGKTIDLSFYTEYIRIKQIMKISNFDWLVLSLT